MTLGSAMTLVSQAGSNLWSLTPGGFSLTQLNTIKLWETSFLLTIVTTKLKAVLRGNYFANCVSFGKHHKNRFC